MADTNTPTFVTQATNFTNAVAGGVDPRTGLYNLTITLGKITGNRGAGPVLPLALRYSPLNRANIGFGAGCTLGFSTLQLSGNSPVLCVSTGEQYGLEKTGETYLILQQKLESFRWVHDNGNYYWILHKSGERERLYIDGDVGYVTELYSPAGYQLSLTWDNKDGVPQLRKITDSEETIFFEVPNGYGPEGASFSLLSDSRSEAYNVDIGLKNGLMQKVSITATDCAPQIWNFISDYVGTSEIWGQWIIGIEQGPGGYQDKAEYNASHSMPPKAPADSMPCVSRYRRQPAGGQSDVVSTYSYSSGRNFLGGGDASSNITWHPDRDSLLEFPFDPSYLYTSTEVQDSGSGDQVSITRTYNAYHLQVEEEVSRNVSKSTTNTEYQITSNADLTQQPVSYQLPITKTVTWNGKNPEISRFTWDDFGNPLTRIDADGLKTEWSYYDQAGEDGCPADPNGFRRFTKWKTVDPTNVANVASEFKDATVQRVEYQYALQRAAAGSPIANIVLKNNEKHSSDNGKILLSELTFTYYQNETDDPQDPQGKIMKVGLLKGRTTFHYPQGGSGAKYKTEEQFSYSVDSSEQDGLKRTHTLTREGVDHVSLNLISSKTHSWFTGRVLRTVDAKQNVIHYEYDSLGRRTKRVLNPETEHENVFLYTNETDDTGQNPYRVTKMDPSNNMVRYTMDATGKQLKKEINDVDIKGGQDKWYVVETRSYDGMGRLSTVMVSDYLEDGSAQFNLQKTLTYDDWGNASLTTYSDKVVETTISDPINKTVSTTLTGLTKQTGTQVTTYDYNFSKKPLKVERFEVGGKTPYSTRTRAYDGLNRLRSETDENKKTTSYAYDDWGRLTKTTLPDNTIVLREYSVHSPEKLVSSISAGGRVVGTRVFDGLGRIASKNVGGKSWTYQYEKNGDTRPKSSVAPDQITRNYNYIPELDEAIKQVKTDNIEQTYEYEPKTGIMLTANSAKGNTASQTFDHYPSKRLKGETTELDGKEKSSQYSYTVAGAPHTYTHIDGSVRKISRDQYGRIARIEDKTVSATPAYDDAARLTGWTVTDLTNQHTLKTELVLDDFGREVSRTSTDSKTNTAWKIAQTWYANDLLKMRTSTVNDNQRKQVEMYTYDSRNRLINWVSTGARPAKDRYGNLISQQEFTEIDALGNIVSVKTTFYTGDPNIATFEYKDPNDPCLLTGGKNTHSSYPPSFIVKYDKAGRITDTGMGTTFEYDDLGRVKHASSELTKRSGDYAYDAHNRLSKQTRSDQDAPIYFYYRANQLVNLIQGENSTRLFHSRIGGAVAQSNTGSNSGVWLLGTDALGSVLSGSDGSKTEEHVYSAYGEQETS